MIKYADGKKYFCKDNGTYMSDMTLDLYNPGGPYIEANSEYFFDLTIEDLKEMRDLLNEYLEGKV